MHIISLNLKKFSTSSKQFTPLPLLFKAIYSNNRNNKSGLPSCLDTILIPPRPPKSSYRFLVPNTPISSLCHIFADSEHVQGITRLLQDEKGRRRGSQINFITWHQLQFSPRPSIPWSMIVRSFHRENPFSHTPWVPCLSHRRPLGHQGHHG